MEFKTMEEAKKWAYDNGKCIKEWDCPNIDKSKNPTMKDLEECGSICENHWACHTWRHIMGSR